MKRAENTKKVGNKEKGIKRKFEKENETERRGGKERWKEQRRQNEERIQRRMDRNTEGRMSKTMKGHRRRAGLSARKVDYGGFKRRVKKRARQRDEYEEEETREAE